MAKRPKLSEQEKQELLMNHVVLPRFLPQQKSSNRYDEDLGLMWSMIAKVDQLAAHVPARTLKMFQSLHRVHRQPTAGTISTEIRALKPGETFAMFVRRQNCAVMIHMPPGQSDRVIVSTFPGNLHPKVVYEANSDLEFNYPSQMIKTKPSQMMYSEEFAYQLSFFYQSLPVETENRNYVSKWLLTVLADVMSETAEPSDFPVITKKLRDEVLGSKNDFFRRSSFYMCMKVFLQHSLTVELGPVNGKMVYKLLMIGYLSDMLDFFNGDICEQLNIDLMSQAMAKLARRIEKCNKTVREQNLKTNSPHTNLYKTVIRDATETIDAIRGKIDDQIKELQTTDENNAELAPLRDLDFLADIHQKIPNLTKYLDKRSGDAISSGFGACVQIKPVHRHRISHAVAPPIPTFGLLASESDKNLFISDFENWILYKLDVNDQRYGSDVLRTWCKTYAYSAKNFYTDDQLGMSKMVLVRLKLICMLDLMACATHPLLREHRSCINPAIINSMLLPQKRDMTIALQLENYFRQRNQAAKHPGLIEQQSPSNESFTVKFAAQSSDMQRVIAEIKQLESQEIERKRVEHQINRDRVEQLRRSLPASCDYYTDMHGKTTHAGHCTKCAIERQIKGIKMALYERPLPDSATQQYAIAFELRSPIEIAALRDVLYEFSKLYINSTGGSGLPIKQTWTQYHQIKKHNNSKSESVTLGSTTSSNSLVFYHVDKSFESFIISNALTSNYNVSGDPMPPAMTDDSIKKICTLSTSGDYSQLQWTLQSTKHTQNKVLASQNRCPQSMLLTEFLNFGSLRADGHRLQLRKLYGVIETEALSFGQTSVLALIMQTIWEAGVSGDGQAIRESHVDFDNIQFTAEMIELLNEFCERQKNNWDLPAKLQIAAVIAVRMYEINGDEGLANRLVALLDKIRSIALIWIVKIGDAIKNISNPDVNAEQQLRMKIVEVAIAGAMTFFVHSQHEFFDKIFVKNSEKGYSAPRVWLQFIVTLFNNFLLNSESKPTLHLRMLVRLVRNTGIHVESKMQSMIAEEINDIYDFVKQQWTVASSGIFERYEFYQKCPQVLMIYVNVNRKWCHVTIDFVTGELLVNNLPVRRLPQNITSSALFKRVFGQFIFEVQPDSQNSFSTLQKYNECSFEFLKIGSDIIITEKCDGVEKELIPPGILSNEIPNELIQKYSHFWDKQKQTIEFRPKLFSHANFSSEDGVKYRLKLNTNRLMHLKTKREMLDINSKSYLNIVKHLSRLESSQYIHVLMDEPQIAKVELIRMNLKFIVDCSVRKESYDLCSNEFSRMRVSLQQKCGTLYGLHHGLLLETFQSEEPINLFFDESTASNEKSKVSIEGVETSIEEAKTTNRLLLIPHSYVICQPKDGHVSVTIDIKQELRSPSFHVYQVDDSCRQLNAKSNNYSAWFYLAYLHALTSHGEVEPFTGMSGTERSLQILQSGYAWSSAPYNKEAIDLLRDIAQLSPKRSLPQSSGQFKSFLKVTWPTFIPPRSAQDTFIFIAQRLLDDSQRLNGLYSEAEKCSIKVDKACSLSLNTRDYLRCLPFAPNLRVSDLFIEHEPLKTSSIEAQSFHPSPQTQTVVNLYHRKSYRVPDELDLKTFLMTDHLDGIIHIEAIPKLLDHTVYATFVDLWISLYECARQQRLNKQQFALIWSLLAHETNSFEPILALQSIAMNSNAFEAIPAPQICSYAPKQGLYSASKVTSILRSHHSLPSTYYNEDFDRSAYDRRITAAINEMTNRVTRAWPCDDINLQQYFPSNDISIVSASQEISRKLKVWNNNRKLGIFLESVQTTLRSLNGQIFIHIPRFQPMTVPPPENWAKYEIDYEKNICERFQQATPELNVHIEEAKHIWEENFHDLSRSAEEWWRFYKSIVNARGALNLINAGMYPRAVPSLVLPRIATNTAAELKAVIGALAVTIAREQRLKRIAMYAQQEQFSGMMTKELENQPHVNWMPCEHPEWLLFEIEQNLTIREIQIKVAEQMIEPAKKEGVDAKHSTMQLNMGEGKTAVIAPIIAATLADGKQCCQITVLKSLFATNLKALRKYLGGMLNRRMYVFPCRRDMPIAQHVGDILSIYEECKKMKGVILTLPEDRLSFQLKIYESVQKGELNAAKGFLAAHKWINENVRCILDESDAILHPKYQLVYTLGSQLSLDGGSQRWLVIQALMKPIPDYMKRLNLKLGDHKVEFDKEYILNGHVFGAPQVDYRSDVFTPCRILDESVFDMLKTFLIKDFLDGKLIAFREMTLTDKVNISQLLSEKNINKNSYNEMMSEFSLNERNIILILRGMLRFEVLKLVLMRRWRVNYGVNTKKPKPNQIVRQMAIPFKAKDVAAEMTEFGHPDVALCFTHLSYYYSGLTDTQLEQTFKILLSTQDKFGIYEQWVESVPKALVDSSIRSYTGINLGDPQQRNDLLFPIYRFNMHVIDFYLSKVVFPHEAKSFEHKLMCTAWDFCSDHINHLVTGFSGTNDTKNVLPMPIAQNDLDELEGTNERVRQTLLQPENQAYENLPPNVSGKDIIERLIERQIPVLLDGGALMLELNNLQVAQTWLNASSQHHFDAAVYFDSFDILQTIDRKGIITELDSSVYRENLSRCLVYLDDVHTRGTDLKFPMNWKACVTLSGDITRDKTVQACMRMRQLGKSHSIAFWASYEADLKIHKLCESALAHDCTPNHHVIEFICKNSDKFEYDNAVHWAAGAHNYSKKLIGHKLHEAKTDEESLKALLKHCVDDEFVRLEEVYGDKEDSLLVDIARGKFKKLMVDFAKAHNSNLETIVNAAGFLEATSEAVENKILALAPNVKRFVQALDEEQEKELETEQEEEKVIERPAGMAAATPHFDEQLKEWIEKEEKFPQLMELMERETIMPLANGLLNTQLNQAYVKEQAWDNKLLVTKDFVRVLADDSSAHDEYMRPVWWIAHVKCGVRTSARDIFVLLSSFECDRLISSFKRSKYAKLLMYRSRSSILHSDLLHRTGLQVGMKAVPQLDVNDVAQIAVFAGSMYFNNAAEQDAYCRFLGLIARPRTEQQEIEFEKGHIKPNGFVPLEHRSLPVLVDAVGQAKFNKNPVDLAIKLIEAHHHVLRKESHAASILERGIKSKIEEK